MRSQFLLEPDQRELLVDLAEAARNVPKTERGPFFVAYASQCSSIIHPGLLGPRKELNPSDLEILSQNGLLVVIRRGQGGYVEVFDVTPLGFQYYEEIKRQMGQPVQRIEATLLTYLDASRFQAAYPKAYAKWVQAESLLWQADVPVQLTTIGHLCREAMQEFADALGVKYDPANVSSGKAQTVARIKAVLEARANSLGDTERKFLEALRVYWGTVSDLVQRQEHDSQKEGASLVFEDGRRLVFQTAVVMFEIDQALSRQAK